MPTRHLPSPAASLRCSGLQLQTRSISEIVRWRLRRSFRIDVRNNLGSRAASSSFSLPTFRSRPCVLSSSIWWVGQAFRFPPHPSPQVSEILSAKFSKTPPLKCPPRSCRQRGGDSPERLVAYRISFPKLQSCSKLLQRFLNMRS